jgi:hypothetical protein
VYQFQTYIFGWDKKRGGREKRRKRVIEKLHKKNRKEKERGRKKERESRMVRHPKEKKTKTKRGVFCETVFFGRGHFWSLPWSFRRWPSAPSCSCPGSWRGWSSSAPSCTWTSLFGSCNTFDIVGSNLEWV